MDMVEMVEKRSSEVVVRWEKYLPKMVLRVLLVEADDATRQIIAALLRKCSYRVDAVPDGLMAWETLKGRSQNIDLILTELDLPSISGFALLTLVTEDETCKNIPVIMMSSQDSVSMVLKCMLKGAADFLMKPVRKNELKNLWQHVWRRHTLQGGSVCQSLPASQNKLKAMTEINAESNHLKDYKSSADKNAIDTHSSCSTLYTESENSYMQNMQGNANFSDAGSRKLMEDAKPHKELTMPWCAVKEKFDDLGMEASHAHEGPKFECFNVTMDLIGAFDNHPQYVYGHDISKDDVAPELELSLRRSCPRSSRNQDGNKRQKLCYSYSKSSQPVFPTALGNPTAPKTPNESHEPSYQLSTDIIVDSELEGAITSTSQENITSWVSEQSGHAESTCQSPQADVAVRPVFFPGSGVSPHGSSTNQTEQKQDSVFLVNTSSDHSNLDTRWSEETVNYTTEGNNMKAGKEKEHDLLVAGQTTCINVCTDVIASHDNSTACGGIDSVGLKGESVFSHDGFGGMGSQRSSQREAALTKFRLKRKDRCFEKKVRYQRRKKLAEQRPRVKGQFVRASKLLTSS